MAPEADFSGYATKAGLKCSDGRTITPEAFKHLDGQTVPLVWQHGHTDPKNVLGHAKLEARDDGIYAYGFFNDTESGKNTKILVQHGDVKALSIYANQLKESVVRGTKNVVHGMIREVSLVIAGANAGAYIDQVKIVHGDGPDDYDILEDEAVISMGLALEHGVEFDDGEDDEEEIIFHADETVQDVIDELDEEQREAVHSLIGIALAHAAGGDGSVDETIEDVYNTLTPKQQKVVQFMIGAALEEGGSAAHSDTESNHIDDLIKDKGKTKASSTKTTTTEGDLTHQEGMETVNVFDKNKGGSTAVATATQAGPTLSHSDIGEIFAEAKKTGSWKTGLQHWLEDHAELKHSITDIELLFPDAQTVTNDPQFISRRMGWVAKVLAGTKHSPFSKVKTTMADITGDEARAKGYVKGNLKTEEVLGLLRRTTGPTTIYKKQKLDRDDMVDITDIDVVLWLKAEMRLMIEEELARCILVGDGRSNASPDKVKDPMGAVDGIGIRSVLHDHDLFAVKVDLAANVSPKDAVKGLVRARSKYRGTGKPTLFCSDAFLTEIMLEEDKFGRPLYETEESLRDKLRVDEIVTLDLLDEQADLFAIMVSLVDYTVGSNRGGELTSFEDFDIDYNQYKYLQETRLSGGLTKPYSAVVVRRSEGSLATAEAPSFDGTTNTITIPTTAGVVYTINDEVVTGDVVITGPTTVEASPADGYYLAYNTTRDWTYTP